VKPPQVKEFCLQHEATSVNSLFRENALRNLNSSSETHHALNVIKPTSWIIILCSILFLTGIFWWACWGRVVVTIPAIGIIIAEDDFNESQHLMAENIKAHEEKVRVLQDLLTKKQDLYNKHYLTIMDVEAAREAYLTAKEELTGVVRQNYVALNRPFASAKHNPHPVLDALVFVTHAKGKKVVAGMQVFVLPNTVSLYDYGYIQGKVVDVSEYPISKESVYSYLGNMSLIDEFFGNSAPFMIKIRLKNSVTPSGLAWTTQTGPTFKIEPGTTITAKIVSNTCSPIQLLTSRTAFL
jgi:hypothetical protein